MSVLAVERCLVRELPSLFSPEMVFALEDDTIRGLAAETKDTSNERDRCSEKLAILEVGLRGLKRLDKHRAMSPGEAKYSYILPFYSSFQLALQKDLPLANSPSPSRGVLVSSALASALVPNAIHAF